MVALILFLAAGLAANGLWAEGLAAKKFAEVELPGVHGGLSFSPDGKTLAVICDPAVCLLDSKTGTRKAALLDPEFKDKSKDDIAWSLHAIAFSPGGNLLAVSSGDKIVRWNVSERQIKDSIDVKGSEVGASHVATEIAYAPTGALILSLGGDALVGWHVASAYGHGTIDLGPLHDENLRLMALSPKQDWIALAGGGSVSVHKMDHLELIKEWEWKRIDRLGSAWVKIADALATSPDGRAVAIASENEVALWDVLADKKRFQKGFLAQAGVEIRGLAFSPDGALLAGVAAPDSLPDDPMGHLFLWDLRSNAVTAVHQGGDFLPELVAFSPDGKTLAAAGGDRLRLYSLARGGASGAGSLGGVAREDVKKLIAQAVAESAKTAKAPAKEIVSEVDAPRYKAPERPDDLALVVGIQKYGRLPEADFAQRDAKAVKAHLAALGVPKRNVIELSGQDATLSGIKKYLNEWLPRNAKKGSRVYFYFSGHGAPDTKTGQAYLVPWDGDPKYLASTAYPVQKVYQALAALPASEVVAVLDACFSGAGGRSVLPKGVRPLVTKVETGALSPGKVVAFGAAGPDEITGSLESEGHGLFTYHFLKGLNGAAQDGAGAVTVRSLYDYLARQVPEGARRDNREQMPQLTPSSGPSTSLRLR